MVTGLWLAVKGAALALRQTTLIRSDATPRERATKVLVDVQIRISKRAHQRQRLVELYDRRTAICNKSIH